MAVAQIILWNPNGTTSYDVTLDANHGVLADSGISIDRQLEDDQGRYVAGDVSITAKNRPETGYTSGWWSALWTLPMNPEVTWDEANSRGTWYLQVKKGGAVVWDGDVDPVSISFNDKDHTVSFTVLGKEKRAERTPADLVNRCGQPMTGFTAVPSVIYTVCTKGGRHVKLYLDSAHASPLSCATYGLLPGDILHATQLTQNGGPVDQDMEIHKVYGATADATHDPTLAANEVLVRAYPKKAFTQVALGDPWYKGKTVGVVAAKLFNKLGLTSTVIGAAHSYSITGSGASYVVDVADFKGKSVADCLTELAAYAGMVWFATPTTWYLQGRESSKSGDTAYDITSYLKERARVSLYDKYFLSVIVRGTKDRFYRASVTTSSSVAPQYCLEIQTDYTSDLTNLQTLALMNYGIWSKRRAVLDVTIKSSGRSFGVWDLVKCGTENWWVLESHESMRANAAFTVGGAERTFSDEITLKLLQVTGTAATAATSDTWSAFPNTDAPLPPTDLELGRKKDDGTAPSWWTTFRGVYDHDEWPDFKVLGSKKVNGVIYILQAKLWVTRFKWPWGGVQNDPPDGFQHTVCKMGNPPSKPCQQGGRDLTTLECQADGYYYIPWYKDVGPDVHAKDVYVQAWDWRNGMSAYSDPATTSDAETFGSSTVASAPTVVVKHRTKKKIKLKIMANPADGPAVLSMLSAVEFYVAQEGESAPISPPPHQATSASGSTGSVGLKYMVDETADSPITANDQFNGSTLTDSAQASFSVADTVVVPRKDFTTSDYTSGTYTFGKTLGGTVFDGHGYANGTRLVVHLNNATNGTLYYVVNSQTNTFQVALTSGGAATNPGTPSGTMNYLSCQAVILASGTPAAGAYTLDSVWDTYPELDIEKSAGSGKMSWTVVLHRDLDPDDTSQLDYWQPGIEIRFRMKTGYYSNPTYLGTPLLVDLYDLSSTGSVVTFYTDVNGGTAPYKYRYDWGDGTSTDYASGAQTQSHTWSEAGYYTVVVTVKDSLANPNTQSASVTVCIGPTVNSYTVTCATFTDPDSAWTNDANAQGAAGLDYAYEAIAAVASPSNPAELNVSAVTSGNMTNVAYPVGLTAKLYRSASAAGAVSDLQVQLFNLTATASLPAGPIGTPKQVTGTKWPATPLTGSPPFQVYGGAHDLWGLTPQQMREIMAASGTCLYVKAKTSVAGTQARIHGVDFVYSYSPKTAS